MRYDLLAATVEEWIGCDDRREDAPFSEHRESLIDLALRRGGRNAAITQIRASGDWPLRNPITGSSCCCASAATGATLPTWASPAMNSRRFIRNPQVSKIDVVTDH
jgi:hypothetical protein